MSRVFAEKTNILFKPFIKYNNAGVSGVKKVYFGIGGVLMIAATLVSDSAAVIAVYAAAAALHEGGHLLAARIMGIAVDEIRFGFSGVRIVTGERLLSYKKEFLLAFCGPLINLTVFFAILAYFLLRGEFGEAYAATEKFFLFGEPTCKGVFGFLALSSLLQAAMNLLPIKSFDGGRMLYCLTARFLGIGAAEITVTVLSALCALFLWTLALYLMLRVAGGLGIFVFAACIFFGLREGDV